VKIETEGTLSGQASEELIHRAVFEDEQRGGFVSLCSCDQHYIQAAGDSYPFHVEYREGTEASHKTAQHAFTAEELEEILIKYFRKDSTWKDGYRWMATFSTNHKPWWKFW